MSPLAQYAILLRNSPRFLAFGFLMAFTSSAGQTYFIGIFGPEIRETFALNHTQWGSIYLVGTLCSAAVLPWSGNLLDRIDLRLYTAITVTGLAIACLVISFSQSVTMLVLAIFLLRQFGQGLTSHTSVTSMARYMTFDRGKSLAIASTGYSTAEALLPVLAVTAILALGWRQTYQLTALAVILLLPVLLFTLRGHDARHRAFLEQENGSSTPDKSVVPSRTRREMLREARFYMLLPAILAPAMIGTGLFFHHLTIAETKGWSPIWMTGNYWIYALCTVATALASGPVIDRYSASRVLPWFLLPLVAAMLILVPGQDPVWVIPYMVLLGINTGIFFTGISALWAELYGARYLGGIKSAYTAFMVFASAIGPVSMGIFLDFGYGFDAVFLVFSAYCLVATGFLFAGLRRFN